MFRMLFDRSSGLETFAPKTALPKPDGLCGTFALPDTMSRMELESPPALEGVEPPSTFPRLPFIRSIGDIAIFQILYHIFSISANSSYNRRNICWTKRYFS